MPLYSKPYLTTDQQIRLLKSRGIVILDEVKAKACLTRIGYYRLSAYWYPFKKSRTVDEFRDGTDFSTILDLYVFDKKLRLLVLDALERIEIALRTDIAILLGRTDPKAHRDPNLVHGNFSKKVVPRLGCTRHEDWLRRLDKVSAQSKEEFAKHFRAKYSGDDLPIWISVELWDFGTLSHFFGGMKVKDQDLLASEYGLPNGRIFATWIRCLNVVRNTCAHHSRLWNRPLVITPSWPKIGEVGALDHLVGNIHGQTRLYAALVIMRFILNKVNPTTSWAERLIKHVETLPSNLYVTQSSAGFPLNWEEFPIWK